MHFPDVESQISETARRFLDSELERLVEVSTSRLRSSEREYDAIGDKTLTDQMRRTLTLALYRIAKSPLPESIANAAFETGQLRAVQQVELITVSRAFRIDLQVLWEAFLQDAERNDRIGQPGYMAGLLKIWDAVEANINEMTEGYRTTSEKLRQQNTEIRTAAFQRLMDMGAGGNVAGVAKQLSILYFDVRQPVIAVVSDIRESDYSALSVIQTRLSQRGARSYFGWHHQHLIGLIQAPGGTDGLPELLRELGEFRTAFVEVQSPAVLTRGLRNARILVAAAQESGVRNLADHWLEAIAHAEPALADALAEQIFSPFDALTEHVRDELTRVLDGYFSTNGTIVEISGVIFRHRNTVRNRLAQIEELTGLALDRPVDSALLALAFQAWKRERPARIPLGRGLSA